MATPTGIPQKKDKKKKAVAQAPTTVVVVPKVSRPPTAVPPAAPLPKAQPAQPVDIGYGGGIKVDPNLRPSGRPRSQTVIPGTWTKPAPRPTNPPRQTAGPARQPVPIRSPFQTAAAVGNKVRNDAVATAQAVTDRFTVRPPAAAPSRPARQPGRASQPPRATTPQGTPLAPSTAAPAVPMAPPAAAPQQVGPFAYRQGAGLREYEAPPGLPPAVPSAPTQQGVPGPQGVGGSSSVGSYVPASPITSGLGEQYDSVANSTLDAENDIRARLAGLEGETRAAIAAILSGITQPTKNEFTAPWDAETSNYKDLYVNRSKERQTLFDEEQARLQQIYDEIRGGARSEYDRAMAGISGQLAQGQAQVGAAQGQAQSRLDAIQQFAAEQQAKLDAARQARSAAGGEAYAKYGLSGVDAAGQALTQANQGSALPPEVLAALAQEATASQNQRAASARTSASSSYNAAIERILQDMADTTSQSYGRFQTNGNELLGRYAEDISKLLGGRTTGLKEFYDAEQGAAGERTDAVDLLDNVRQILGDMKPNSEIVKAVLGDITSDTNNRRTVGANIYNTDVDAATSRANNADTNATSIRNNDADNAATWDRFLIEEQNKTDREVMKQAAERAEKGVKVIKGEDALRAVNAPTAVRNRVREIVATAKQYSELKEIVDPETGEKVENPMYKMPWEQIAIERTQRLSWMEQKTVMAALRAYNYGVEQPAPKAGAAPKAAEGLTTTRAPSAPAQGDNRVTAAKAAFQQYKSSGKRVDGYNASSAQHKKVNPKSDHDTGRAFDYHLNAPNDAEAQRVIRELAPKGLRYVIHNGKIYQAKNGWKAEPYGGKFSNGMPKDPHRGHIHINF